MTAPPPPAAWVWLARIRRSQGRKGEVFADILTDFPQKFAQRRRLWLLAPTLPQTRQGGTSVPPPSSKNDMGFSPSAEPREVELLNHWPHKTGIVLHFAGIDSISAAEALAGLIVAIPAAERAQLPPGEVHIADLIGCKLIDVSSHSSKEIGVIENVERSAGPVPLLLVQGASGQVLIPFTETFLRNIDLEQSRIEMSLPEGLVDLNAQ